MKGKARSSARSDQFDQAGITGEANSHAKKAQTDQIAVVSMATFEEPDGIVAERGHIPEKERTFGTL